MANYYSDHPELEFHLSHPLMKRVVDLQKRIMWMRQNMQTLLLTTKTPLKITSRYWK